jgi:predicted GNAT family acetyltransferase
MDANFSGGAQEFLSSAGSLLASNEPRYGLVNGIVKRLVNAPHYYGPEDPWFCTASDETGICAAAIRTAPFAVLLAHFSGDAKLAARTLADAVSELSSDIPGATGDVEIAGSFAEYWCAMQGVRVTGEQAQRIYRLDNVSATDPAPGHLRVASPVEKELLARWHHSSSEEIYGAAGRKTPEADITPVIERKDIYLWEDSVPVSMAARANPTENGITVNRVYTPPEFRRRGYATSCVSALCSELLRSGYKFCMLYTDLANPISNSIYKRIGFREVCDSVAYYFSNPAATNQAANRS